VKTILYIHGMGGGGDSRIPRLLREQFEGTDLRCIVRTYDFDPETGHAQIASWVEELHPDLVIGESLGAIQALRVRGIPHLFVSPSLERPTFWSDWPGSAGFPEGRPSSTGSGVSRRATGSRSASNTTS
jgi:hypothetical protein